MAEPLVLVEDDQLPDIKGVAEYPKGTVLPLNGYTVKIHIDYKTEVLTKVADITDAAAGEFEVTFDVGDLRPGRWECHVVLIDAAGKTLTLPGLTLVILPKKA